MGLDIYFYKVKNNNESIDQCFEELKQVERAKMQKLVNEFLNKEITEDVFFASFRKLGGNEYETQTIQEKINGGNQEELTKHLEQIANFWFPVEDVYFRKVNCIYGYFVECLENECCWVNVEQLEDIVQSCKDILDLYDITNKDNSKAIALAKELLPTTSGCFFGSTEYDEYYFRDLENIQYKFEKLIGDLQSDEKVFVIMSW